MALLAQAIREALQEGPLTVTEIAERADYEREEVKKLLRQTVRRGSWAEDCGHTVVKSADGRRRTAVLYRLRDERS